MLAAIVGAGCGSAERQTEPAPLLIQQVQAEAVEEAPESPPAAVQPRPAAKAPPKAIAAAAPLAPLDLLREVALQDEQVATGDRQAALQALEGRLAADPRSAVLHYLHGRLLGNLDRIDQARAAFDRAVALDPKLAWAYRGRGIYHLRRKQYDKAQQEFERAHQLEPTRPVFLSDLAQVCHLVGQRRRALELIGRAIVAQKDNPEYRAARATMLYQERKLPEAIAEMRRTLALDRERHESYWFLAELLVQEGELQQALELYQRLVLRKPPEKLLARARTRATALEQMLRDRGLSQIRQARDTAALRRHLQSKDVVLRREAYKRLLVRRHASDLPSFYRGLSDADAGVRVYCARGLGELGDAEAAGHLIEAFRVERSEVVRGAIAGAIGRRGRPPLIPRLAGLLQSELSAYVVEQLAAALAQIAGVDPGVTLDASRLEQSRRELAEAWRRWWKTNPSVR